MSNVQSLIDDARMTLKILSSPTAKKLIAKHPDVSWRVITDGYYHRDKDGTYTHYKAALIGEVDFFQEDTKGFDILEIATGCNEDSLHACYTPVEFSRNGILYKVEVEAYQNLSKDQKDVLTKIGKIVTVTPTVRPYQALVCS